MTIVRPTEMTSFCIFFLNSELKENKKNLGKKKNPHYIHHSRFSVETPKPQFLSHSASTTMEEVCEGKDFSFLKHEEEILCL